MIKEMKSQVFASGFISVILATLVPLSLRPKRWFKEVTPGNAAIGTYYWDGYTSEKLRWIYTQSDGLEDVSISFQTWLFLVVMLDFRGVKWFSDLQRSWIKFGHGLETAGFYFWLLLMFNIHPKLENYVSFPETKLRVYT